LIRTVANLPVIRKLRRLLPARRDERQKLLERMPVGACCAEIGVWRGGFSQRILDVTRPGELHLVDPWTYQPHFPERLYGGTVAQSQADMDRIFDEVTEQFADRDNVRMHRTTSRKFLEDFDGELDWVYIDGDHSTAAVLEDLSLSRAKVKASGVIAGDDYYWKDADGSTPVRIAVDRFCSEHGYRRTLIGGQFIIRMA